MLKSKTSPRKWKNKSFLFLVWILFFTSPQSFLYILKAFLRLQRPQKLDYSPVFFKKIKSPRFFFTNVSKLYQIPYKPQILLFFVYWLEWKFGDDLGILEVFPAFNFFLKKKKFNWFSNSKCELKWNFTTFIYFLSFPPLKSQAQNVPKSSPLPPPPQIFFSLFIQKKTLCIKRALLDSCSNLLLFFGERWVTSYNNFNIITVHMLFFFNFTVSSSSKPFSTEVPSTVIMNSLLSFSIKWIMQIVK